MVPEPYTRAQYIAEFKKLCDEEVELTSRKNNDYGGETDPWKNFREFGLMGILVRMSDKWSRIKTALWEKRVLEVATETVEDTLKDLSVYCKIAILWIRRQKYEAQMLIQNTPDYPATVQKEPRPKPPEGPLHVRVPQQNEPLDKDFYRPSRFNPGSVPKE